MIDTLPNRSAPVKFQRRAARARFAGAAEDGASRAESFSEYVGPPGLEILLILVSTNRPLLTELERHRRF
jgi:hypothetical protein